MEKKYGSRAEVYHGKALMTTGKLKKQDYIDPTFYHQYFTTFYG